MSKYFLYILALCWLPGLLASESLDFDNFIVDTILDQKVPVIDISSHPKGEVFKEQLQSATGNTMNYGGQYYMLQTGCGTMCQVFLAVDITSGKLVGMEDSNLGGCFQENSKLLILNPFLSTYFEGHIPEWAYTYYYEITENGFSLLSKTKKSFTGLCKFGQ